MPVRFLIFLLEKNGIFIIKVSKNSDIFLVFQPWLCIAADISSYIFLIRNPLFCLNINPLKFDTRMFYLSEFGTVYKIPKEIVYCILQTSQKKLVLFILLKMLTILPL